MHQPPFPSALKPLYLGRLPTNGHERHLLALQLEQTNMAVAKAVAMLAQLRYIDAAACANCASLYYAQASHTMGHLDPAHPDPALNQSAAATAAETAGLTRNVRAASGHLDLSASLLTRATTHHHVILSSEFLNHLETRLCASHEVQDPAHAQTLMTLAGLLANTHDLQPAPRTAPTGDTLEQAAHEARRAAAHTYSTMAAIYSPTLTHQNGSRLSRLPGLCRKLEQEIVGPNDALAGVFCNPDTIALLSEAQQRLDNLEGHHRDRALAQTYQSALEESWIVPFVLFAHNGAKIAKHVLDPYPRGYPEAHASAHMSMLINTPQPGHGALHPAGLAAELTALMLRTASDAVQANLHTLSPEDLSLLLTTARQNELPPTAVTMLLRGAAAGNDDLVSALLAENPPAWQRAATLEQTRQLLAYARSIGIDGFAALMLANTLGYHSEDLGITPPKLPQEARDNIEMALRFTPVPEAAIQRLHVIL